MKVRHYHTELAFELPDSMTEVQMDDLHDRVATQYSDVTSVLAGICNPPLIVLKFSDLPTEEQVERMRQQIGALAELSKHTRGI